MSSQNRSTMLSIQSLLVPDCPRMRCTHSCNNVNDHAGLASLSLITMNGATSSAITKPRKHFSIDDCVVVA